MNKKTASERLKSVNETKLKCIELNLTSDLATKILFTMLDQYHRDGTTYIGKELRLSGRTMPGSRYVVNLYNDRNKRDVIIIKQASVAEDDAEDDAENVAEEPLTP